jgi:hypothetical protein
VDARLCPLQVEFAIATKDWDGFNEDEFPTAEQIRSRSAHLTRVKKTTPLYPQVTTNAELSIYLADKMMPSDQFALEQVPELQMMCVVSKYDAYYGSAIACLNKRIGLFILAEWEAYGPDHQFILYSDGTFGDIKDGYAHVSFGVMTMKSVDMHNWRELSDKRNKPTHHFQPIMSVMAKSESQFSYQAGLEAIIKYAPLPLKHLCFVCCVYTTS